MALLKSFHFFLNRGLLHRTCCNDNILKILEYFISRAYIYPQAALALEILQAKLFYIYLFPILVLFWLWASSYFIGTFKQACLSLKNKQQQQTRQNKTKTQKLWQSHKGYLENMFLSHVFDMSFLFSFYVDSSVFEGLFQRKNLYLWQLCGHRWQSQRGCTSDPCVYIARSQKGPQVRSMCVHRSQSQQDHRSDFPYLFSLFLGRFH